LFKTVTESSGETQVSAEAGGTADTQTMKFLTISRQVVPLICSNQATQKEMAGDGHWDSELLNYTFIGNAS